MCGITGFIADSNLNFKEVITSMTISLAHRGPDNMGIWLDEKNKIAFGHARLSILDLSETGNQPMISKSGRYVILLNGEIYNHKKIRKEIDKVDNTNWLGTSDTETIMQAIDLWGLDKALEKCVGMFAIALLDRDKEELILIRDRMGEKPLYYGWIGNNFIFTSEIISLNKFPGFDNNIDRDSLALYLMYSAIPEPYSIYKNFYKLESGSIITYNLKNKTISKRKYWDTLIQAGEAYDSINNLEEKVVIDDLEKLLLDAVKMQMQADVHLGAFLSGGLDSSLIVALMQAQSDEKVSTFTIGYKEKKYNEAGFAKEIAKHLGTNHHEMIISGKDVLDIVEMIPKIYSEPFSEASQLPTFIVSKMAKKYVSVSLSGDAGDELFCGYSRYNWANRTWNNISKTPPFIQRSIHSLISKTPQEFWRIALSPISLLNKNINYPDKFLKFNELLKYTNRNELYAEGFMSHNAEAIDWVIDSERSNTFFTSNKLHFDSFCREMQISDLMTYLPNNNLTKVDRAAMANSLETRVPFLDHRVVNYALKLPLEYKYRNGVGKWILRQILYKYVPKTMIERPKMGFAVPLETWLRGPLKDWSNELLDPVRLKNDALFNTEIIRKKWDEHQSGKRNWHYQLWDVIVFNLWLDEQKKLI